MSELSIKDGLSCLFGVQNEPDSISKEKLVYLFLSEIIPNKNQPRKTFHEEGLLELSDSIKKNGVLQPILVRRVNEKYEIIAGERRYRAALMCNLEKIPCLVEDISEATAFIFSIIENIQRKSLDPIEEAESFCKLIEFHRLSHEEAAQYIGKSRSHFTNSLRLLQLAVPVKKLISDEKISMGQGRALLPLSHEKQIEAAEMIVSMELNTRQTEALVKKMILSEHDFNYTASKPVFLEDYSEKLTAHLDSKFKILKTGEKFKISGVFESEHDFKKFLLLLGLN